MKHASISIAAVVFVAIGLLLPVNSEALFSIFSSHKPVQEVNGEVRIPVADVGDGEAHYYSFKTDATTVKFFVIKSADGVIRAAFDACDVCFPAKKGYTQDGDFMICKNCGRRFHSSRINVEEGGCNPAPLKRTVAGDHLVLRIADIKPGGRFF